MENVFSCYIDDSTWYCQADVIVECLKQSYKQSYSG